jgi:thioredoxin 1
MSSPRQTIITRLRAGKEVDEWADLCIYPSGSLFVVEFIPPDGPLDLSGLTDDQSAQLRDEGELSEYCETPEEAADLYLLLEARFRGKLISQKDVFTEPDDSPERKQKSAKKGPNLPAVDEELFEEAVSEGVVVVLCWSPWSAPDRMVLPVLAKLAAEAEGVKFVTVDIAECPSLVSSLKLTATPTVVVFRAGAPVANVYPVNEAQLREVLSRLPR